ncbi:ABC transporter permease [Aquabacterium sp. A7-Y]|uniref:ABC transporter permease n=1 Tax=Aquabacterium sp. A7-Y TaxID=1349605 RepID=UPI00223D40D6|nr:ABC transporter permease [Aquabacterium sp. A7-Y]MCW7538938.1 ABC transporter permease [Aquabacterium sp. A7-Y]
MSAIPDRPVKRTPWQVQRAVLFALFVRELKTRFGGRWLGVFWVLLEPLAHLTILVLIFGFIRHRVLPGVEFPVFLLTGLVPFFLFKNLTLRLMESITSNQGLFGYRQVKPFDPLVSRAMLEVSLYSVVYLIMLGVLGWLGFTFLPVRPLELLAISVLLILMGASLGLLFAVTTHEFPHARSFVRIVFMPLYLMSGVVFPVSALPPSVLPWLLWNPVLHAIEISRGYFFAQYHVIPSVSGTYVAAITLIVLALGMSLYRVRRHKLLAS